MKKTFFALYCLLFTVVLAGCGPQKQTPTQTNNQPEEKKGVFESIRDAMNKSLSLKCDYSVGENKSVVFIKGKMLRSETESQGNKNYAVLKDNKLWTWSDKEKSGLIIDLTDSQNTGAGNQNTGDQIIEDVEKYRERCQQTVVADSLFNPPADITFQDLSQMMKNFGVSVKP
ncbi:MAG: hypothetical protein BWY24_00173 [Microgenomates group bacterium ADurb.Bin219]|nr:MAG: hypothetical protein BWY24_00173 [Microgenomates group bacterium ADurb.Bin219]HNP89002.1 hypothetical protein [Candidatus Woesebacteria bacterium]